MSAFGDTTLAYLRDLPRIGDRLASFSVLLPAEPAGRIVIATTAGVAAALMTRFPDATVLHDDGPVGRRDRTRRGWLAWDGRTSPLAPGTVGLLIVDSRVASVAALLPALAPGGTVAVLGGRRVRCEGSRRRYLIYPSIEHPQQVWTRGWPVPAVVGRLAQLKRALGLRAHAKRGVPRLVICGPPAETLAGRIGSQLRSVVGERLELVGIETAGHTVLHFRGSRDWAVRLSLTDAARDVQPGTKVAAEVPAAAGLLPREIMRGRTGGHPWSAEPWVSPTGRRLAAARDVDRRSWSDFGSLAEALQTVITGRTFPGWGRDWCAAATLLPAEHRARYAAILSTLDDDLPTGWCHGDPWPPNLLRDGANVTIIDWDNATDRAPLGLDWLLIAAARLARAEQVTMAVACARLLDTGRDAGEDDGDRLHEREIGGRRWADWDRPHQVALVLAAYLLHLRNRSMHDLGADRLRADLAEIDAALDREVAGAAATEPAAHGAGRAARGAAWLALSAAFVKAGQTLVMLAMAAVLEPSALGLLAIGWLVVNVAGAVADLGCSSALVYWRGDPERAARSALTVSVGLSIVLTGVCWVTAPWLAGVLNVSDGGVGVIRGLTSVLPCYAVAEVTQELLRRELAFLRRIVPDMLATLCGIAVTLSLLSRGHGVDSMVVGQIVQGVLTMLISWAVRRPVRLGWRWADVRGLVRYGRHLAGGTFAQLMLLNVDYIIVANVLGSTQLGRYSLAFRIAYLPFYNVAGVICTAAFPYLCRVRRPLVGHAAAEVVATALGLVLPIFTALALFAPQLELLGEDWAAAVPALRWLCCYGVLLSLIQLCQTPLNAVGRPRDSLALRALHLVLLTGVLLALVHLGVTAVAVGQVLAGAAVALAALALVHRNLPGMLGGEFVRAILPSVLGVLAMVALVLPVQLLIPATRVSAPALAPMMIAAFAAFAVPVWLLARDRFVHMIRLVGARS